jgi:hypothetical protein
LARADAGYTLGVLGGRLRVEGHAFEVLAAVVALKALWVKTDACGRDDAPGDGERTVFAEDAGADRGGCPVGAGRSGGVATGEW